MYGIFRSTLKDDKGNSPSFTIPCSYVMVFDHSNNTDARGGTFNDIELPDFYAFFCKPSETIKFTVEDFRDFRLPFSPHQSNMKLRRVLFRHRPS